MPGSISCYLSNREGGRIVIITSNNFSYLFSFSSLEIPITIILIGKSKIKAISGSVSIDYFSFTGDHIFMLLCLANFYYVLDIVDIIYYGDIGFCYLPLKSTNSCFRKQFNDWLSTLNLGWFEFIL